MLPLVYHENYSYPFPEDHRFVMSKFRRLYTVLKESGICSLNEHNIYTPQTASIDELSIAHDPSYLTSLVGNEVCPKAWRRVGLPWSKALIERTLSAPNGTMLTAKLATQHGIACHLAGGTHHAHKDYGSGFCIVNDLAYTALSLLRQGQAKRVLIFDCDVHQGDGTASILSNEDDAYTCSIHCEKNFPFRKTESDIDIGLPLYMEDDDYLEVVDNTLERLLYQLSPDIVLYDAGVDVWEHDALGKLNISWKGIEQRDQLVLKKCLEHGVPVATVIGGGYDKDHDRLARRHAIVVEQAHKIVN